MFSATVTVRYESLQADAARLLPQALGADDARIETAFAGFRADSIGRWRSELSEEQLADVESEAGDLLRELGYTLTA